MFSGFSGLSGWKRVFLADTDLAATIDLAFYLKEPLILGLRLAISVLQPLNFHLAMPNYGYRYSFFFSFVPFFGGGYSSHQIFLKQMF